MILNKEERHKIISLLTWDYNISVQDIDDLILGVKESAGHYNRTSIFRKTLCSFPWMQVIKLFPIEEIKKLLTPSLISSLWPASLRKNYSYILRKLNE